MQEVAEDEGKEAGEVEEGGKESGSASLLADAEKTLLQEEYSTLEEPDEEEEEDMEHTRWVWRHV